MDRSTRFSICLTLLVLAGSVGAGEAALARTELGQLIDRYVAGDATERGKVLVAMAGRDELRSPAEVKAALKTVQERVRKARTKLQAKPTDLLARLQGKQRQFNQVMGIGMAPVAELSTPVGAMRAIIQEVKGKAPAVLIYLHGGGNSAKHDGAQDNEMAWGWGLVRGKALTGAPFRVMPRCLDDQAANAWIKPEEAQAVDALLDGVLATWDVSPDQIHLFGVSMGGFGVWNMGSILADRFATVIDATGGYDGKANLENLRNTPFAAFLGGKDPRAATAKKGIDQLAALRAGDVDGYAAAYSEYPEVGHDLPDNVLADINGFLTGKVRRSRPRIVVWKPTVTWKKRFFNLAVESPAPGMSLRVVMGADNAVTISSSGIDRLSLYLDDALADLDKEVRVTWNGRQVHAGKAPRRSATILETFAEHTDAGMTFTARLDLVAAP